MKSIKEKAEAYDKVLEWATEAHKVCDGMLKEDLEHLFPELKESEDERIRKAVVDTVMTLSDSPLKTKMLSWLEAQGEQNPAWSKGDKVMLDKVIERLHKHSAGDKEYLDIYYWLIALKDRVQPQNKWKESLATADLENSLCDIQDAFSDTSYEYRTLGEAIEFIRCTEQKPQWKPSDEQTDALHYVTNFDYGGHKATLVSLYEQLKKLKG